MSPRCVPLSCLLCALGRRQHEPARAQPASPALPRNQPNLQSIASAAPLPLLYCPPQQGWWWYEVCPWHHIYQYHQTGKTHDDGKPEVDWSISLGSWAGSAWAPNATTLSGLFPHHAKVGCGLFSALLLHGCWLPHKMHGGSPERCRRSARPISPPSQNAPQPPQQVPYVVQAFSSGDKCERDPEPGTAKPRPDVPRSTELRFACSPDSDMHLTVAEPDQVRGAPELLAARRPALQRASACNARASPASLRRPGRALHPALPPLPFTQSPLPLFPVHLHRRAVPARAVLPERHAACPLGLLVAAAHRHCLAPSLRRQLPNSEHEHPSNRPRSVCRVRRRASPGRLDRAADDRHGRG